MRCDAIVGKRTAVARIPHPATLRVVASSSIAPSFLVAMPQLRDPNFRRSVVLLVHHDEEGTFGVVLNRPTEITAMGLCATLEVDWCGAPEKGIGWGGPVQPQTGWLLFGDDVAIEARDDVKRVGEGVHFAGSLDVLRRVAQDPPQNLHVLLGYAGWGPGQLESELAEGAWLIAPVSRDVVFGVESSVMWDYVLRSLGIEPSTLVASRGIH
jgi:putative transcriptional regulator